MTRRPSQERCLVVGSKCCLVLWSKNPFGEDDSKWEVGFNKGGNGHGTPVASSFISWRIILHHRLLGISWARIQPHPLNPDIAASSSGQVFGAPLRAICEATSFFLHISPGYCHKHICGLSMYADSWVLTRLCQEGEKNGRIDIVEFYSHQDSPLEDS